MRINNNVVALNSLRQQGINSSNSASNMERLSSGFRVNRAADDAAGLAISEKMRAQIRGLNQASRNTQDAISLVQVAEGGLQTAQNIMHRIRELAVQGANDTNTQSDRDALALEVFELAAEIAEIGDTTEFNTMRLFHTGNVVWDGTLRTISAGGISGMVFQVGANADQTLTIDIDMTELSPGNPYLVPNGLQHHFLSALSWNLNHVALALQGAHGDHPFLGPAGRHNYSGADQPPGADPPLFPAERDANNNIITQQGWISHMIMQSDLALESVSKFRAHLGAIQNRLEHKMQNLDNAAENTASAESRIRDVDMAQAMTEFTRNNIISQASTAMLAQANALPQGILQLLG